MEFSFLPWRRKGASLREQKRRAAVPMAMVTGWHVGALARGYEAQVRESYLRNAIAQRAVRLVAESAASAPWMSAPTGHPALQLLARPNPCQPGAAFIEALASHLVLAGNAYVEVVPGPDDMPLELHLLRPERVTVVPGPTGWPQEYRHTVGGTTVRYGVDPVTGRGDLLHIRTFHPLDDHYGLSPLEAAQLAIETHNAAGRWNKALLENAARPCGALVFEPGQGTTLTQEQFDRLKAEMEAGFQGAQNAGRPLLLEGGLKWQALSLSPAELDFIEARNAAAREVALAFGVPPMLLGLPGDNTYANYGEANRALWRLTVLPLLTKIADSLSAYLGHWWEGVSLDIDRNAIPALAADRERLWRQVATADFLSAQEKRRLLGLGGEGDG
ncbi:phage portal protein [Pedomonas mirosovicensis]|uniref:phage portal protein n=1 Tax=Pedomonas mirosovicensis TaxID=2908641 RepID=UPI002169A833|nr:phage portal protein [Pedomonas mirosovicensis]MCH8684847.1 phage portal protein [Pedomonas mirosovicensis]